MPLGGAALSAAREVQVLILALLLIGACAAKARRGAVARSLDGDRLRRSATLALCASELGLGTGLILTAGQAGAAPAAVIVRSATALLFAIALAALNEMRSRRPNAGCGCFGDLSDTPVSVRSLTRAAVLCAAALTSIGAPPLRLPSSSLEVVLLMAAGTAELLLLAALSPEVGEIMVRLGYSEPCEARRVPVAKTLAALRASREWRYSQPYLAAPVPTDIWREGCWRFLTYPATIEDRKADIVFAVYLQARRPAIRTAVVDGPPPVFDDLASSSSFPRVANNLDTYSPLALARPAGSAGTCRSAGR
ncbi:MAG TPA: MauE/DoxX family redox-associated membrane protein [Trebonia sp.]|nr:MauE/DoxX family redox-associated membrane protein [Trebonia sp.]